MLIKKAQSKKFEHSKVCAVWEYDFNSKNMSVCTAWINGRYPNKKRVLNLKCEATYFVISGSGIIHSEKGDFKIQEGDLYFFEKKEKYCVEGKQLRIVETNYPKWTLEQHKIVE